MSSSVASLAGATVDNGASELGLLPQDLLWDSASCTTRADLDQLDDEAEIVSKSANFLLSVQGGGQRAYKERPRLFNRQLRTVQEENRAVLYDDKEKLLASLDKNPFALQHASDELRADFDVVMTAVAINGATLEYAAFNLKVDREVALLAVKQCRRALEFVGAELRTDRDFVLAAVSCHGTALQYALPEFRADYDVVRTALQRDSRAIQFAAPHLQNEASLVAIANVVKHPEQLCKYADLFDSMEFVRLLLSQNGLALEHVKAEWRDDYELVKTAIEHNPWALEHASQRLRREKALVYAAMDGQPEAFRYADCKLCDDAEIAAYAARKSIHTLKWVLPEVCKSQLFLREFFDKGGRLEGRIDGFRSLGKKRCQAMGSVERRFRQNAATIVTNQSNMVAQRMQKDHMEMVRQRQQSVQNQQHQQLESWHQNMNQMQWNLQFMHQRQHVNQLQWNQQMWDQLQQHQVAMGSWQTNANGTPYMSSD